MDAETAGGEAARAPIGSLGVSPWKRGAVTLLAGINARPNLRRGAGRPTGRQRFAKATSDRRCRSPSPVRATRPDQLVDVLPDRLIGVASSSSSATGLRVRVKSGI